MPADVEEHHDDARDESLIPDALLTLSEGINMHAALMDYLRLYRPKGDAVLETAAERLRLACRTHGEQYPDQLAAVAAEIAMQARLNSEPEVDQ